MECDEILMWLNEKWFVTGVGTQIRERPNEATEHNTHADTDAKNARDAEQMRLLLGRRDVHGG